MRLMAELTMYLRFLVISNILLFSSCNDSLPENNDTTEIGVPIPLTREDSVLLLAKELNIEYDSNNINDVLAKILISKNSLISRLDSLDSRANEMESAAIKYKKKKNTKLRNELLSEINKIKAELNRIKQLSGITDEFILKNKTAIPEVKVPEVTSSFENLPSGNYIMRLDKYHLISIYVKPNGQVIISDPKLDSTTVIRGSSKMDSRITKELEQIRKKIKN